MKITRALIVAAATVFALGGVAVPAAQADSGHWIYVHGCSDWHPR